MKITHNTLTNRYIAQSSWAEKDVVKGAGFRWDPTKKLWWTDDRTNALKLRAHFDETARKAADLVAKKMDETALRSGMAEAVGGFRFKLPDGKSAFGYQNAGVQFCLGRKNTLLGDDMGLGKTLQAIGVINETQPANTLIICPASLKLNWLKELKTWLVGEFKITVLYANGKHKEHGQGEKLIYIVNYDIVGKFDFKAKEWDLMVIDEVHNLANAKSGRSREIWGGKKQDAEGNVTIWKPIISKRTLGLTGTPVTNRPANLWNLISHLDAETWKGKWMNYMVRYCGGKKTKFGWDVSGATNLEELNGILRGTIMLRRLKADVLKDLPAKMRKVTLLETDKKVAKMLEEEAALQHILEVGIRNADVEKLAIYLAMTADVEAGDLEGRTVIGELAKIRRIVGEIKAPLVADYAKELLEGGLESLVIFAHHKSVVEILEKELAEYGVVKLVGGMKEDDKNAAVEAFQAGKVRVFIGSTTAAGVGLTLTRATHTLFAEVDWVPGNLEQAEDRTHRIGQLGSVISEYLIFEGSIDTKMIDCVENKRSVIAEITK